MDDLLTRMVEEGRLSALDLKAMKGQANLELQSEQDVLRWLSQEYQVGFDDLEGINPEKALLAKFPARVLLKEGLLPLRQTNGSVEIATSRLFSVEGFDTLRSLTGLKLKPVLAPTEALDREIKKRLGVGADTIDSLGEDEAFQVLEDFDADEGDLDSAAEDASIIRFVNQVLSDAIELRTTDVHIEPFEDELRIRYRIDGVLQEVPVPAQIKKFQSAIVSRVKILSHLNIAEKRVPQDGRIKVKLKEAEVDIRVSVIPMIHGEAVVLRLLRQDSGLLGMRDLGMADRELNLFEEVLGIPHGIVLVTGPTGSGKTTSLYTALNAINDSERKIITVEDPVEYQMKGVNQIQVSEKAGLTFARGLRAILRHDPDVVLVGEIRDQETAQIAVQASLTGHLVFSTLHTNDAPGALTRLVDMGVERYLVASSLEAVLAQRLVRVLCPHCKTEDRSDKVEALRSEIPVLKGQKVYQSQGCRECRQTGYHGRRGIFEMMDMTTDIRKLLLVGSSSGEIRVKAREQGMRSLAEDGWRLVAQGATTPNEILRVSKDEDSDRKLD